MEDTDYAILIAGCLVTALITGTLITIATDDFAYDFCKRLGHTDLQRSDAEPDSPYIVCYDTVMLQGKEIKEFHKYELTTDRTTPVPSAADLVREGILPESVVCAKGFHFETSKCTFGPGPAGCCMKTNNIGRN